MHTELDDKAGDDAEEARLKALYRGQPETVKAALAEWEAANPAPHATVKDIADHIDHVVKIAGAAHAGIGADLDGITTTPEGLESVATYPSVFAELIRRGYTDEQLKGIAGLNVLRVMRKTEAVAARLQKERPPAALKVKLMIGRPPCCCSKVALASSRSSPPTTTIFSTGRHCGW